MPGQYNHQTLFMFKVLVLDEPTKNTQYANILKKWYILKHKTPKAILVCRFKTLMQDLNLGFGQNERAKYSLETICEVIY